MKDHIETEGQIAMVAIADLMIADDNPRSNESVDQDLIEQLADNIFEQGVLVPLIGYEHDGKALITAGGRRTRALDLLVKRGERTPDYPVPVKIMHKREAIDAGFAEQLTHVALSPTDELRIFQGSPDASDARLAKIVGKSAKYVAQRRAILSLPKDIVEGIFSGDLTVTQGAGLTYYLDCPVEEIQQVAAEAKTYNWTGDQIRAQYKRRFRAWNDYAWSNFVTRNDYERAGGRFQADLFAEDEFVLNPEILTQLGKQAAFEHIKKEVAPGYGYYEVDDRDWWSVSNGCKRFYPKGRDLTEEEEAKIEALEAEQQSIAQAEEKAGREGQWEWEQEADDAWEEIEEKIDAIRQEAANDGLTDEVRAELCVVVVWQEHARGSSDPFQIITDVLPADVSPLVEMGAMDAEEVAPAAKPKEEPIDAVNNALSDRIAAIRLHVTRQELAKKPDEVISRYVQHLAEEYSSLFLSVPPYNYEADPSFGLTRSSQWEAALKLAMAKPKQVAKLKPAEQRKALAARMLMCLTRADDHDAKTIRAYWTPDETFMNFYKKDQLEQMVRDNMEGGEYETARMKKGELAKAAASIAGKNKDFLPFGF